MTSVGSDGSIILSTKVDQSGLKKGMTSMKNGVASISKAFLALGTTIATVFSITAFLNYSKAAGEMATQTEASIQRLIDIYGQASQTVGDYIDNNARAIGMSKSAAASFASVYGNLFSVWADQKTNAQLTTHYLNMTAVVASKTGRTMEDVQERIRSGLLGNTEAVEDLGVFVNVKTIEMTEAFKRVADGRSWEQLNAYEQSQVRTLAIMEQATSKYGSEVAETTALVRARYNAAYQDLQATWGQFVNTVLMPILKVATDIFNVFTRGLQMIMGLSGKTIDSSKLQAENMNTATNSIAGATDNQNSLTKAVKGTAKEQKKLLAGFDDLQIISANNSEASTQGTGGGVTGVGTIPELQTGSGDGGKIEEINTALTFIMGIVGGALIAVGLILLFNGNIPWGIGFIIAGAFIFSVSVAALTDGDPSQNAANALSTLMGIIAGALVAIGVILLFLGSTAWGIGFIIAGALAFGVSAFTIVKFGADNIEQTLMTIEGIVAGFLLALGIMLLIFNGPTPLSIGLIITGAAVLAITVAQIVAGQVEGEVAKVIHAVVALASAALLVLGLIMLCTGHITPLSIGLLAAGAVGLATEIALNWEFIKNSITTFFEDNAGLIIGVSLALLVLGIILCCIGLVNPLSIGLLAAGAAGLANEIALNWEFIEKNIDDFIIKNSALIKGVSAALVVLGIILLFSGVGTALGIGLLVAGGVGYLATEIAPHWDFIVEKVKEIWDKIKTFWNEHIAPWFTKEKWTELAEKIGDGLKKGFKSAINGIITIVEKGVNWIIEQLNKISFDVPEWVPGIGGKKFGFNLQTVKIPRLAQGAVIPPNREFLAVLGDQKQGYNIETPLETMVQAFQMALDSRAGNKDGSTTVILEIDGREFGRAVVEHGKKENRRIGTRLVIG